MPDPNIDLSELETEHHNYELVYEFEVDGIVYQRLQCVDAGCDHISDGWWKVTKEELW